MKNNQGFSLIELMISIAIIGILASGVAISTSLLAYADAKSCAEKIDTTLGTLRLETMSQGSLKHYMVIEWNATDSCYEMNMVTSVGMLDTGNWKTDADTISTKKIAGKNISVYYTDQSDGSNLRSIDSSDPCILISFNRSSGAFESSWKQIVVKSRSDISVIHMVIATGKHYVKD